MRVTFKNSHYLIEGPGKAMDLITKWLKERDLVLDRTVELAKEVGAQYITQDEETGVLTGVVFPDRAAPVGWTKPDKRGVSRPKAGSEWHARFKAQVGHTKASPLIKEAFGVPTTMICRDAEGRERRMEIGNWFHPCGFATLGAQPPYLLLLPNVAYYVAKAEAQGYIVPPEVKAFKPEFEGCRPISEEDWELLELRAAKENAAGG